STGSWGVLAARLVAGLEAAASVVSPASVSASSETAPLVEDSMRNGPSRGSLINMYFDIICRYSGDAARFQSMRRSAPCASWKHNEKVWCSSSWTGSSTDLN